MNDDVAIVVVDDDRLILELLEDLLEHFNKKAASFSDGWSAWMYLKSHEANLVISDVHMDGIHGLDLLQGIKQVFPQIKCIMISGDYSSETPALKMGADAFLCKPFDISALIQKVDTLCPADTERQDISTENSLCNNFS